MTTDQILLAVIGLAIPVGLALHARWSRARLERDDPARRGGPAE